MAGLEAGGPMGAGEEWWCCSLEVTESLGQGEQRARTVENKSGASYMSHKQQEGGVMRLASVANSAPHFPESSSEEIHIGAGPVC